MSRILILPSVTVFLGLLFAVQTAGSVAAKGIELNDVHSQLNATHVFEVLMPRSILDIQDMIKNARQQGKAISISGGKHAMGGQQFGSDTININMSDFNKVIALDSSSGIVEVQAGITWPDLVVWLEHHQHGQKIIWGIRQKQTGTDHLTIGGALSANAHGRGLTMGPLITDVDSFTLIDANGDLKHCSREENPELFKLVIGGYGLFGVIATVKLRLMPLVMLKREVHLLTVNQFIALVDEKVKEGFTYGDFQFAIDSQSPDFMYKGIASFYQPVYGVKASAKQKELSVNDWILLLKWAHTDKTKAFNYYSQFYLSTNGQIYSSDTMQMGVYIDNYHQKIDSNSSEMISEIYVPRSRLTELFAQLRDEFRKDKLNLIYGTVRLIRQDKESFLPWAKQDYACIVVNLHVQHSPQGIAEAQKDFQFMIDKALAFNGSYYLTYHRWARKDQVLKAYPQFEQFLMLKKHYDPKEVFQSDWYRHYEKMFQAGLGN